jgi:hypothetical protein
MEASAMARPDVFWGEITPCEHSVQIYDDDAVFLDALEGFIAGGLRKGDAGLARIKPWSVTCAAKLGPRGGSALGDRKRLAAVTAPQVQVMVRGQDNGKGEPVAIEAGEPLENRLRPPRLLGSKVHGAGLLVGDCHLRCIRTKYTPAAPSGATPFRERTE